MPSRALTIAPDHPAFDGHFPGRPILPGVALVAAVLEAMLGDPATAAALEAPVALRQAKFHAVVGPGAGLRIEWNEEGRRRPFTVWREGFGEGPVLALRGEFEVGTGAG